MIVYPTYRMINKIVIDNSLSNENNPFITFYSSHITNVLLKENKA